MRFACLVASALLATGCGVPDVNFTDGGSSHDATRDSPGADAFEAGSDDAADGQADAEGDANGDAADAGDAKTDAPEYCKGEAGPPVGYVCCMGSPGEVCAGNPCSSTDCAKCGSSCTWPSRCCASGNNGTCFAPDASGGC